MTVDEEPLRELTPLEYEWATGRNRKTGLTIDLTVKELSALRACLQGEVENDDGSGGDYMPALRRILRKVSL